MQEETLKTPTDGNLFYEKIIADTADGRDTV